MAGLLLAGCIVDAGVETFKAVDRPPPSVAGFAQAMAEGNVESFVDDLNKVRGDPEPEILTFLLSLWREASGESPPRFLQNELVRVELANNLAQAQRYPAMDVDVAELHEFIRRAVRSSDEDVRQRAVLGLAIVGDPTDISLIAQMMADPDEPTFRSAVITLSSRCQPDARAALDRAEASLSEERAAFLAESRETYGCPRGR